MNSIRSYLVRRYEAATSDYKKDNIIHYKCGEATYDIVISDIVRMEHLITFYNYKLDAAIRKNGEMFSGVIADKAIIKGDVITFFPVDFIQYTPGATGGSPELVCYSERYKEYDHERDLLLQGLYCINVGKFKLMGCPDFDNSNYLGHMIREGTELSVNCRYESIDDLQVAIVALRDIEKGEELLMTKK